MGEWERLGRRGQVQVGRERRKKKKKKIFKTQYKDICLLKFIICNYNNYNIIQPGI